MHPVPAIGIEGRRAEQLGQLPGSLPPQEIHLEEALLAVEPAGRPDEVEAVGCRDGRNAQIVALDLHRCR